MSEHLNFWNVRKTGGTSPRMRGGKLRSLPKSLLGGKKGGTAAKAEDWDRAQN